MGYLQQSNTNLTYQNPKEIQITQFIMPSSTHKKKSNIDIFCKVSINEWKIEVDDLSFNNKIYQLQYNNTKIPLENEFYGR